MNGIDATKFHFKEAMSPMDATDAGRSRDEGNVAKVVFPDYIHTIYNFTLIIIIIL